MRSLVFGASAGLGRSLAEKLAELDHELFIVSRDGDDLQALAQDLIERFGATVHIRTANLEDAQPADIRRFVFDEVDRLDNLFYVAGYSYEDDSGQIPDDILIRLVNTNYVSCVRMVNVFLSDLADNPGANIVGMGSVAAGRGRRNNSVYASAKRGMEFYFEALRHYLAKRRCRVQFYRLGYLDTQMTFGQNLLFPVLSPSTAAEKICRNLGRDLGRVYLPFWWLIVMTTLNYLPWRIFRKLDI